ncbi:hypothetical protein GOBAR_DD32167 [Gossypium barbadense]|nr:hypothetical protein GOBAR_DD32167 [Gossypium barbadense]
MGFAVVDSYSAFQDSFGDLFEKSRLYLRWGLGHGILSIAAKTGSTIMSNDPSFKRCGNGLNDILHALKILAQFQRLHVKWAPSTKLNVDGAYFVGVVARDVDGFVTRGLAHSIQVDFPTKLVEGGYSNIIFNNHNNLFCAKWILRLSDVNAISILNPFLRTKKAKSQLSRPPEGGASNMTTP